MSLVHPVIEPQVALRACKGRFFGTSQEWVALLYSNRVVFTPTNKLPHSKTISANTEEETEEIVVGIPQPPMTMGDKDQQILPNIGGVFFAVGRNRDMLVLQYFSSLAVLSINAVNNSLELQGVWGLPKLKDASVLNKSLHSKSSHSRVPSAASLVALAEHATLSGSSGSSSSGGSPSSSSTSAGRSGLSLSPQLPPPKPSPDGTQIFVATRSKYGTPVLLILSCYGKETIRLDVDYLDIMTLGWISDELVYFVYMNNKFHKKFQVCRLTNRAKGSGLFGMGRRSIKPSFVFEINVPIALDYQPSQQDVAAGPDLVFKDCVMLGTRSGGYLRVNFRAGAWEPVLNAKNIVGAVSLGETALIIQSAAKSFDSVPTASSHFSFAVVSNGTVHALRSQPEIGACLSCKHSIDSERRFILKLLHLDDGIILDYKRRPFRLYQYQSNPTSKIKLIDDLPVPPMVTSKLVRDFLVKTEQALYTRDPNGDDNSIHKIIDRSTILDIPLERAGLVTLTRRDIKSLYAVFTTVRTSTGTNLSPEIVIFDESQSKLSKLRTKAMFNFNKEFDGKYANWFFFDIKLLHRNVITVTLTSNHVPNGKLRNREWEDGFSAEWVTILISFVGSTSKRDHVSPKGYKLLQSKAPELPPRIRPTPGDPNKFTMQIFNRSMMEVTKRMILWANTSGEHSTEQSKDSATPVALDRNEGITFLTDDCGPLDGFYIAGTCQTIPKVSNALLIDCCPRALDGTSIALAGSDPFKTTIWLFDCGGKEFREYSVRDIIPEKVPHQALHEQNIKSSQQKHKSLGNIELSPEFHTKHFTEISSNSNFRPLPEIPALICRGIGYGVDAEIFVKTPDDGIYAMFRIQNRRLHESLAKLEKTILDNRVGSWLTDEARKTWISQYQDSTMITGNAFGAYWQLSEEQQQELCSIAGVDSELIKRMRPP